MEIVRKIYKAEGVRGFYPGFNIAFIGPMPALSLYFGTYELVKERINRSGIAQKYPSVGHIASGVMAETVACVLFVPIDVVKERMQVQARLEVRYWFGLVFFRSFLDCV